MGSLQKAAGGLAYIRTFYVFDNVYFPFTLKFFKIGVTNAFRLPV
jgi:hypothetical protein